MQLEVFADVACPWCYIGKRRLDRVLAEHRAQPGAVPVGIVHRAFLLQPGLPPEGLSGAVFYPQKFGGEARMRAAFERVAEVGRAEGITFAFDRIWAPNTRLAHRAVKLAAREGRAEEALAVLYRGHFEEGVNVGRVEDVLASFERHQVALDRDRLRAGLVGDDAEIEVDADLERAAGLGVGGVPLFLLEGRWALEGAQPPALLRRLLEVGAQHAA